MNTPSASRRARIREYYFNIRGSLKTTELTLWSESVCKHLAGLLRELASSQPTPLRVASYKSVRSEVDLEALETLVPEGQFAYPRVEGLDMRFYESGQFCKGSFGITEPVPVAPAIDCHLNVVLVPGVAFDRQGGRLGYGKGFYDLWLQGRQVLKVGIAYGCQISEVALAKEEHDVAMDLIATENYILGTPKVMELRKKVI